jgi:hypothetical protein
MKQITVTMNWIWSLATPKWSAEDRNNVLESKYTSFSHIASLLAY